MGKAGRFACIFVPLALTVASLICLLVVFLGGLNKNDANLRSLWYFKADTSEFKANGTSNIATIIDKIPGVNKDLANGLLNSVTANELEDVYYVYMWNYCSGTKAKGTGAENITFCSPRKAQYYFNPITVWGLNNSIAQNAIPKEMTSALNAYAKASKWMFIAYAIAFWSTVATVVVGLFAICSRIGSLFTTIVSSVSTVAAILAAITSTVLFSTVVAGLNTALKPYQVRSSLGSRMLAVDWLAAIFSAGASLFWLVSICCCSGKSNRRRERRDKSGYQSGYSGFASRGYQPIGEQGQQPYNTPATKGMEMQDFGHISAGPYKGRDTAYEPFRQV